MEDANTKVLLHFDGVDGSTAFTDSSETPHTWTAYGNAQIDTAQKKFGTGAGLFDGTGDYIDTPDSEDFNVGSGDFTIDFWLRRSSVGLQRICGQCDSGGSVYSIILWFDSDNKLSGIIKDSATSKVVITATALTDVLSFHHIAFIRNGNNLKLYVDGTNVGSVDVTGFTVNNVTSKFAIGRMGEYPFAYFNGWIDEFRFSKGIARWTENFTPPTQPYLFGWPGKIFGVSPAKIFGVVPKKVCGI